MKHSDRGRAVYVANWGGGGGGGRGAEGLRRRIARFYVTVYGRCEGLCVSPCRARSGVKQPSHSALTLHPNVTSARCNVETTIASPNSIAAPICEASSTS